MGELPGGDLCGVHLLEGNETVAHISPEIHAELFRALEHNAGGLVEPEQHAALALLRLFQCVLQRERRFSGPRMSHDQSRSAAVESAAENVIELRHATVHWHTPKLSVMFGRDEAREQFDA